MGEVRLFPVSRSKHFVARAAAAISIEDDAARRTAWRAIHRELALALLDRGVEDQRVDLELLMLFRNGESLASRRADDRARRRQGGRLRLVPPAQMDLFSSPTISKPVSENGRLDFDAAQS